MNLPPETKVEVTIPDVETSPSTGCREVSGIMGAAIGRGDGE
jgi:hypothetical protein